MVKSKEWSCAHLCDMTDGTICEHLEVLLPSMRDGSSPRILTPDQGKIVQKSIFEIHFPYHSPKVILALIRSCGILDSWDIDLLEAKYVHNLSLREITAKFDWTSTMTTQRRLDTLKKFLRERRTKKQLLAEIEKLKEQE